MILRQFRAAFRGPWQQALTNRDDFSRRTGFAATGVSGCSLRAGRAPVDVRRVTGRGRPRSICSIRARGWCRCRPMAPGSRCAVPCHQPLGGCTATPADAYSNPSGSRWGATGPKRPITSTNGTSCGTLRGANGAAWPVRVTLRTCRCDQTAAPRVVGMIVQELQRAARWPQSD